MDSATNHVRAPAVAGTFYPEAPSRLRRMVSRLLRGASTVGPYPKALIVPHAGYPYSGPVAASGYRLLSPIREVVHRVVLMGPSHHVRFYGVAASEADGFATPLGNIPVDVQAVHTTLRLAQVHLNDEPHVHEHSLEVQLPFLQATLGEFKLVPFVIGETTADDVSEVLDLFFDDPETLIVISSDLSHYHDYATTKRIDGTTAHLIERLQWRQISPELACGSNGIRGLLKTADEWGLQAKTIDLRNSGDTAGPKDEVVGYGSFVLW